MTGTHQHSALAFAEIRTGRICYVWGILFPLVYLLFIRRTRQDPFLRFHSIQCLLLAAIWLPCLYANPHTIEMQRIIDAVSLVCLLGWLTCLFRAKKPRHLHLPIIGIIAERLARM